MQFLTNYVHQVRRTLGELSTAAKMALGLLLALVAMVLVWFVAYLGGRPETVSVFETPLTGEELGHAEHILRRENIGVDVSDGLLWVPANKRDKASALLAYESLLPSDGALDLGLPPSEPSMFIADSERRRQYHLDCRQFGSRR